MKKMETVQFSVSIEESNEFFTLLLDNFTDDQFFRKLICDYKKNAAEQANDPGDSAATTSSESDAKVFMWPDAAVRLLMELYREKEQEFKSGMKKHNVLWKEIAAQLHELNYEVNALQCSTKFSGLRRTCKNIKDQNKKSDNSHSSWAFYSAMDLLIADKAFIHPPAEAS